MGTFNNTAEFQMYYATGKKPDLETQEGVCWEKSTEAHGFQAHKQDTAQMGTRK